MWIAIGIAVAALAVAGFVALRYVMGRPMFEPGTVARRVAEAGGTLDPADRDPSADRWRVEPGIELAHDSFGEGSNDLLFVHGGPGFPVRRRPRALELLSTTLRVHVFDQRGCGASTRPFRQPLEGRFDQKASAIERTLGLAQQVADLERIRRRLGRERLVLVGHSFGALVASLYASEFPERVRALVLVSPAPLLVMPGPGPDLFATLRARMPAEVRPEFDRYMAGYFDVGEELGLDEATLSRRFGSLRRFYRLAAGTPGAPDPANEDAGGFLTLATYLSLGMRHDWRPTLARITAPTLVLHGADDMTPEAATLGFAAAIPGARVVVLPGVAHFALDEAPAEVATAVLRFLASGGR